MVMDVEHVRCIHGVVALVKFDFVYIIALGIASSLLFSRRNLRALMVIFVIYAITVCGWGLRNLYWSGSFFITTKDAVNLWIGNSPSAAGRDYLYGILPEETVHKDKMNEQEKNLLKRFGIEQASRSYYKRMFINELQRNPMRFLGGLKNKAFILASQRGTNPWPHSGAIGQLFGQVLFAGGLIAAIFLVLLSKEPIRILLGSSLILSSTILIAVFILPRYLAHIIPLATACLSIAAYDAWRRLQRRLSCQPGWTHSPTQKTDFNGQQIVGLGPPG